MSAFTFGQSDVIVTMTPEKPRPGLKPMVRRAYARFGSLRERTVQELCQAIGGDCVYVEFSKGNVTHTVAVPSWNQADDLDGGYGQGRLSHVADALHHAALNGVTAVAYGSDRVRWTLSFANERQSAARDVLDAEPDSVGTPRCPGTAGPGGMKEEF